LSVSYVECRTISPYFCAPASLSVTRVYLSQTVDWIDLIFDMGLGATRGQVRLF